MGREVEVNKCKQSQKARKQESEKAAKTRLSLGTVAISACLEQPYLVYTQITPMHSLTSV